MLIDVSKIQCCDSKTQTNKNGLLVIEDEVCGCGPSIIISVTNNCTDPPVLSITASGLPEGGDLFLIQVFQDGEWVTVSEDPFSDVNGTVEIELSEEPILGNSNILIRLINEGGTIISNEYTIVVCPPTLFLEFNYNCPLSRAEETVTFAGFTTPTTINLEYSDDDGATWHNVDDSIIADGDGTEYNDNVGGLPGNGDYLLRAISDDETIVSNIVEYTVNCEIPFFENLSVSYDCETGEVTVEMDVFSSIYDNVSAVLDFGGLFTHNLASVASGYPAESVSVTFMPPPEYRPIPNAPSYSAMVTIGYGPDTFSAGAPVVVNCPDPEIVINDISTDCAGTLTFDYTISGLLTGEDAIVTWTLDGGATNSFGAKANGNHVSPWPAGIANGLHSFVLQFTRSAVIYDDDFDLTVACP